jgi:hypothetical protein
VAHNGQSSRNRSTACTSEIDFPPTLLALADEVLDPALSIYRANVRNWPKLT